MKELGPFHYGERYDEWCLGGTVYDTMCHSILSEWFDVVQDGGSIYLQLSKTPSKNALEVVHWDSMFSEITVITIDGGREEIYMNGFVVLACLDLMDLPLHVTVVQEMR